MSFWRWKALLCSRVSRCNTLKNGVCTLQIPLPHGKMSPMEDLKTNNPHDSLVRRFLPDPELMADLLRCYPKNPGNADGIVEIHADSHRYFAAHADEFTGHPALKGALRHTLQHPTKYDIIPLNCFFPFHQEKHRSRR